MIQSTASVEKDIEMNAWVLRSLFQRLLSTVRKYMDCGWYNPTRDVQPYTMVQKAGPASSSLSSYCG
jgi:hypothetical protein